MKAKHIQARIQQCLAIAECSNCPRRKVGAVIFDPVRNVDIGSGYNGAPRGGGELCGGEVCLRDTLKVQSGTRMEIGCHHAEMNVLCNAAASTVSTAGAWLVITGEPCLMCAKLLHHAGVTKVICVKNGYVGGDEGPRYLLAHGVEVEYVEGPADPRKKE